MTAPIACWRSWRSGGPSTSATPPRWDRRTEARRWRRRSWCTARGRRRRRRARHRCRSVVNLHSSRAWELVPCVSQGEALLSSDGRAFYPPRTVEMLVCCSKCNAA